MCFTRIKLRFLECKPIAIYSVLSGCLYFMIYCTLKKDAEPLFK